MQNNAKLNIKLLIFLKGAVAIYNILFGGISVTVTIFKTENVKPRIKVIEIET